MDIRRRPGSWNLAQYMTITRDTECVECLTSRDAETPYREDSINSLETRDRTYHGKHALRKLEVRGPGNLVSHKFVDALCCQELVRSDVNSGLDVELPCSPDQHIPIDNVGQHGSGYFTSVVGRALGVVNGTPSASTASVLLLPVPQMEDKEPTYGPFTVASVSDDSFIPDIPDIENLPGRYSMSQVRQDWAARHCGNPSAPGYVPSSAVSLLLVQTHYVIRKEYLAQEETAIENSQTWFTHRSLGRLGKKIENSMKTLIPTRGPVDDFLGKVENLAASPLRNMGKKVRSVADKLDRTVGNVKKIAKTSKLAE